MNVRIYLRRSKNDEGKQQFSLDVQREGCRNFIAQRQLASGEPIEYLDDGKAGDDFHSRVGMRQLLTDSQPGDVIVCRDQSRLGRDAIEVTLAIRDLVRDRGCRLFYYVSGQEVQFANAIDQATTFIQGTGHQMELEAIRSRTREGLRARVREGRIAGGRCYGYALERKRDPSGRGYTVATINEKQAEVVRRIFDDYAAGDGLTSIAKALNREGVPSPSAGRRGTGTWAPSAIRAMLRNPRYRGLYIHGRVKKVRRGGKSVRVKADPTEVITVDIPEWRIVEDDVWFAVHEKFAKRARKAPQSKGRPTARYPLTGIAKCGVCGGAIGCALTKRRGGRVKSYACMWHHKRGGSACPVTVHQPMDEVEEALIQHLEDHYLTEPVLKKILGAIKDEIAAQMPQREVDISGLEAEIKTVRTEQRRLAKAVALADDIPELVAELQQRSTRLRHLEARLEAAKQTPIEIAKAIANIESGARERMADVRAALAEQADRRAVFQSLFPGGLTFSPEWVKTSKGRRRVWRIRGDASLGIGSNLRCDPSRKMALVNTPDSGGSNLNCDPNGYFFNLAWRFPWISQHFRVSPVCTCRGRTPTYHVIRRLRLPERLASRMPARLLHRKLPSIVNRHRIHFDTGESRA